MKIKIITILKRHPVFNLNENSSLEDKLASLFLTAAFIMSLIGYTTNAIFGYSFWMNFPNLLIAFMLLFLPILFPNNLEKVTKIELFIVGFLFFPFIYFTNNAYFGAAPIYFSTILVYFSFYLKGKELVFTIITIVLLYSALFVISYLYPNSYIEYTDDLTGLIDSILALIFMTFIVTIIGATTYRGYRSEKNQSIELMKRLENQNEELEKLTNIDHLTNIYNRKYFMEQIDNLMKHNNPKFFVLMIDIDDFKKVNDEFGHLFGDEVLKKIAKNLSGCLRQYDTLSRYGGEEFSVLVTNNSIEGCYKIAERMRKKISNIKFRYMLKVTVSIGVSKFMIKDTSKNVIDRADKNLYVAKEQGKNQVV